eukprot:TRINITY_DN8101_c0_g1_i1.p1 TRINITY_DN8101_c0_g1~~TRINITY_DN8101_c0_g1_i1.p1  ORF type:complete len:234 (+),score=20.07 TRINITY_DN8101_c0_g1_i1:56-757(+)
MDDCVEQFYHHMSHVVQVRDRWAWSRVETSVHKSGQGHKPYASTTHALRLSPVAESLQEGMTTLMLTDLPYTLTLADLRDELDFLSFDRSYDFIFYPKERKSQHRGYCFVNFVSTAEARRFAEVFVDHKFELVYSPKLSNTRVSRTQGVQENLARIKPGATRSDNFFMDSKLLQHAHGGYTEKVNRGWHGSSLATEWSCPKYEAYESYGYVESPVHDVPLQAAHAWMRVGSFN